MELEVVFIAEEEPEGGFSARCLSAPIFTQGDTLDQLREMVKDAVRCHYPDEATRPRVIRLHWTRVEVIAA